MSRSSLFDSCRPGCHTFVIFVLFSFVDADRSFRALRFKNFTMFHSSVSLLFLLSLAQHPTHGSPVHPRSADSAVITTNFMDPSVIELNGGYYAFSGPNGNPASINVQVASSPNFSTWTLHAGFDALPDPGPWAASPAHVWAPDINQLVRQHGNTLPSATILLLHC
jgi:hypothetical protein